jgi:hypothetical protein
MAYIGMKTDTSFIPAPVSSRHPGQIQYKGVNTKEKNPMQFWTTEIMFTVFGVIFGCWGSQTLLEEYKQRRQQKLHSARESDNENK